MSTTNAETTDTTVATSEITLVQIDPTRAVVGRLLASLERGTDRQSWRR